MAADPPEHLALAVGNLCANIAASVPPADDQGRYVIRFADDIELHCFAVAGRTILEGMIHPIPDDPHAEEALLKRLLQLSLGKAKDHCEAVMLDDATKEIRLHCRLPQDLDPGQGFIEAVEQFLNELEFWRRRTAEGPRQNVAASPFSFRP